MRGVMIPFRVMFDWFYELASRSIKCDERSVPVAVQPPTVAIAHLPRRFALAVLRFALTMTFASFGFPQLEVLFDLYLWILSAFVNAFHFSVSSPADMSVSAPFVDVSPQVLEAGVPICHVLGSKVQGVNGGPAGSVGGRSSPSFFLNSAGADQPGL